MTDSELRGRAAELIVRAWRLARRARPDGSGGEAGREGFPMRSGGRLAEGD
ncbi:MAG: hypothetical protein WC969_08440 [Elusimicrobiota bacterium]|jgi:hypothetical protein